MRLKPSFELEPGVHIRAADFECRGSRLAASLFVPEDRCPLGVVIVVGGPQFRVGSHRQFVELACRAAKSGYPTLAFDHRGLGDSEGLPRQYYEIEEDIRCAIDELQSGLGIDRVVLWSLCDGATASALYARDDHRVAGMVLVNPWLEVRHHRARSRLRNYYGARFVSGWFWHDLLRGRMNVLQGLWSVAGEAVRAFDFRSMSARSPAAPSADEVAAAIAGYSGPVTFILSGRDVTADIFSKAYAHGDGWAQVRNQSNVFRKDIPDADHTFTRRPWNELMMLESLKSLDEIRWRMTGAGTAGVQEGSLVP